MKEIKKRTIVLGTLVILLTMSIIPIQASENKKEISLHNTHENNENVLGTITVKYQSFWATGDPRDLKPIITFNQSETRDFYFDEIDGWIQLNFTIICKQKLSNYTLFPRFTRYETYIKYQDDFLFASILGYQPLWMWELSWKYNNLTLNKMTDGLYTDGQNITLTYLKVGVRTIPFYSIVGWYYDLEPIIVHPKPI